MGSLEDMEEETRSRRGTFSGEGQLLNFEDDEPTVEGFVMMKGTFEFRVYNYLCMYHFMYNR